jgi:hypothetical protein
VASLARAIPLEIKEPGYTLTLPEGFKEVPGNDNRPEARRFFASETSDNGMSNTYLTISRLADGKKPVFWPEDPSQDLKIIGRYSERLNNQDVAVLVAQTTSNDALTLEQSATVSIDPGTLLLDLRTVTDDDKKAQAMMRKIIRSLATQTPQADRPAIQGWRGALICLTMVAVIFVVILARR